MFTDIPNVIGFVWAIFVLRRMYVINNEWFLYIDIENPTKESYVSLSKEKDAYGLPGLDVHYYVDKEAENIIDELINSEDLGMPENETEEIIENVIKQYDIIMECSNSEYIIYYKKR